MQKLCNNQWSQHTLYLDHTGVLINDFETGKFGVRCSGCSGGLIKSSHMCVVLILVIANGRGSGIRVEAGVANSPTASIFASSFPEKLEVTEL